MHKILEPLKTEEELTKEPEVIFEQGELIIADSATCSGSLRIICLDETWQSQNYLEDPRLLYAGYLERFSDYLAQMDKAEKILCLGAAGAAWPIAVLKRGLCESVVAVEQNEKIAKAFREWILNPQLEQELAGNLSYVVDDALHFLSHTKEQFDFIAYDCFDAEGQLDLIENPLFIKALLESLKPGGSCVFNLLISSCSAHMKAFEKVCALLLPHFEELYFDERLLAEAGPVADNLVLCAAGYLNPACAGKVTV